jgi:hypothetical protein
MLPEKLAKRGEQVTESANDRMVAAEASFFWLTSMRK